MGIMQQQRTFQRSWTTIYYEFSYKAYVSIKLFPYAFDYSHKYKNHSDLSKKYRLVENPRIGCNSELLFSVGTFAVIVIVFTVAVVAICHHWWCWRRQCWLQISVHYLIHCHC